MTPEQQAAWCCCCLRHSRVVSQPGSGTCRAAPPATRPQPERVLRTGVRLELTIVHCWREPRIKDPKMGSPPSPLSVNGLTRSHHPPKLLCADYSSTPSPSPLSRTAVRVLVRRNRDEREHEGMGSDPSPFFQTPLGKLLLLERV
jgi:hypothetical protein